VIALLIQHKAAHGSFVITRKTDCDPTDVSKEFVFR
jgi:hypothetical protein